MSLLASLLLAHATPQAPAAKAACRPEALPPAMQRLAAKIQGREPQEICDQVERDTGCRRVIPGTHREQIEWDARLSPR